MPRSNDSDDGRRTALTWVRAAMEVVVGALVCISPWVFGAVSQAAVFWLYGGVALLLLLWAVRILLDGKPGWKPCPLTWCLAGLFLLGMTELLPLPSFARSLLSPTQLALHQKLVPAEPEVLPDGAAPLTDGMPAGSVLSLYPGATRSNAVKLLAVCLLFAVVRNNIASPAALARLSALVLVNGAIMALFAMIQFFSSSSNMLYWTYPSLGRVFGPFVYASHYAFYLNIAIGLGMGLLLAVRYLRRRRNEDIDPEGADGWLAIFFKPLHDPAILWISLALALMIGSVFVSLSRGGILSLLLSAGITLTIKVARWRRLTSFEMGVLFLMLAVGLFTWWSLPQVEERVATLWTGTAAKSRVPAWKYVVSLVADFPLCGTGLGTFAYVEPLKRPVGESPLLLWEHAHNDYLEALIEGGIPRLILSLVTIGVVYRLGWRAIRRHRRGLGGGLALGAVFAFTTIVLHSFVDFGLHMPAIAVLATVVTAHLAELGKARRRRRRRMKDAPPRPIGAAEPMLNRLLPFGASALLVLLAMLLYGEGSRNARAEAWQMAAVQKGDSTNRVAMELQIDYLKAATATRPEDAGTHFELAQALFEQYQKENAALDRMRQPAWAAESLAGLAPQSVSNLGGAVYWSGRASGAIRDPAAMLSPREAWLRQNYLVPALAHGMRARDLCPLMSRVQLWLADQAAWFARADRRETYLARAKEVRPCHPTIWYLAGAEELAQGHTEQAWFNWQRSLTASDQHLSEILQQCGQRLSPSEICDRVMPEKPEVLIKAATLLYPQNAAREQRRPYLERALALASRPDRSGRGEELILQARILDSLDRPSDAVTACQRALAMHPDRYDWRLQLAELLFRQGRFTEAREQLDFIVSAQPANRDAQALLQRIEQER